MLASNKGHVVTIASIAGLAGVNKLADYCASKFAAVGFDESLRIELKVCACVFSLPVDLFLANCIFRGVH